MKNRGYTLLELLGVIVILALLTTLVFPSVLNAIKKSSNQTDKLSMDLISNAADLYIENNVNDFKKRNGSKFIIEIDELIEDGNLPSSVKISDIDNIEDKCVQVIYINNKYTYELKDNGACEYFLALPEEYQQVEYIESTGTQYIDSGLIISNGYQVELKAQMIGDYSGETWFLGNWNKSPRAGYLIGAYKNYLQVVSGNDSEDYYGRIPYDEEIHTYSILNDKIIIDETIFNVNLDYDLVSNITGNLLIGKSLHINTSQYSKNIYYLKIWDKNNNLVKHFIPCYRKSDNEIGMYDLVNDVFYENAGTGTFVKGKDI